MGRDARLAKVALVFSVVGLVLGPASGFAAGYVFAREGEPGPRGPQGERGAEGDAGPAGPPGASAADLSGALVLSQSVLGGLCPGDTSHSIFVDDVPTFSRDGEWTDSLTVCEVP